MGEDGLGQTLEAECFAAQDPDPSVLVHSRTQKGRGRFDVTRQQVRLAQQGRCECLGARGPGGGSLLLEVSREVDYLRVWDSTVEVGLGDTQVGVDHDGRQVGADLGVEQVE